MRRSRAGAALHWTRLALLTFIVVAIVAALAGALVRTAWLAAAGWTVVLAIWVVPKVLNHRALTRWKLGHPDPDSN